MRSRAFRPLAAILSVSLFASAPVHAGPVAIGEVLQVIGGYQNPPELRLRSLSQIGTPLTGVNGSTRTASGATQSPSSSDIVSPATSTPPGHSSDSLLSGVAVSSFDPQRGVEIIVQGDIEGTVCDCGEIMVPGGGFPKWPLLFLAAIPFFFINGDDDDRDTPLSTPTPTPIPTPSPTPQIPEPASLLLFGSGLAAFGAGLRRRHAKAKLAAQVQNAEEG